jgi:uncharacterized membrane protein YgaE (UPF0421/DUF939 family)
VASYAGSEEEWNSVQRAVQRVVVAAAFALAFGGLVVFQMPGGLTHPLAWGAVVVFFLVVLVLLSVLPEEPPRH